MFVTGVLREEEAACAADTGRGQLAQEGAQAVQRRLRRRQSRLYHQARREVPRQIRDRLAHRQGLFRTGESMSEDTLMLPVYFWYDGFVQYEFVPTTVPECLEASEIYCEQKVPGK